LRQFNTSEIKCFNRKAYLSLCNSSSASEGVTIEFNIALFCHLGLFSIYLMFKDIKIITEVVRRIDVISQSVSDISCQEYVSAQHM
jgi:hypothetical protein